jgi:8-hydroxy-5-deazaflavin:NADPH oxidoreductase
MTSRLAGTWHQLDSPAVADEPVPIIGGTGALGFGVALRLARGGTPVVIGSRDPGRAAEAAAKLKQQLPAANAIGLANDEAARQGGIVLLCVPFRNQSENLTNLKAALQPGQILVDATVPLAAAVSGRATRLLGVPQGSAGLQAAEMVADGVQVVSALHSVSAATLNDLEHELDEDILVAGDSVEAKKCVAELIARIDGLRPVNAGRLEASKLIEGLTPLLIGINSRYKTHAGIRITGLPEDLW